MKLIYSVIVLSKNKQYWFIFYFFYHDWQVPSLTSIWNKLKKSSFQWKYIADPLRFKTESQCQNYTFIISFIQQIYKLSHDNFLYSIIFSNLWKLSVLCCKQWEKCNCHKKQYCCYFAMIVFLLQMCQNTTVKL